MFASTLRSAMAAALIATAAMPALAQEAPVKLFKMITPKDDVVIGFTDAELHAFGSKPDVDNLAERLVSAGQISAWQYAVKKGVDGNLVQAPLKRVAVMKSDALRIEPYNPAPLKALPHE